MVALMVAQYHPPHSTTIIGRISLWISPRLQHLVRKQDLRPAPNEQKLVVWKKGGEMRVPGRAGKLECGCVMLIDFVGLLEMVYLRNVLQLVSGAFYLCNSFWGDGFANYRQRTWLLEQNAGWEASSPFRYFEYYHEPFWGLLAPLLLLITCRIYTPCK